MGRVFYIVDKETLEDTKVIAFEDIEKDMLIRMRDDGEVVLYKDHSIVRVTEVPNKISFQCEAYAK